MRPKSIILILSTDSQYFLELKVKIAFGVLIGDNDSYNWKITFNLEAFFLKAFPQI